MTTHDGETLAYVNKPTGTDTGQEHTRARTHELLRELCQGQGPATSEPSDDSAGLGEENALRKKLVRNRVSCNNNNKLVKEKSQYD